MKVDKILMPMNRSDDVVIVDENNEAWTLLIEETRYGSAQLTLQLTANAAKARKLKEARYAARLAAKSVI